MWTTKCLSPTTVPPDWHTGVDVHRTRCAGAASFHCSGTPRWDLSPEACHVSVSSLTWHTGKGALIGEGAAEEGMPGETREPAGVAEDRVSRRQSQ